jgi:hypothetical protein
MNLLILNSNEKRVVITGLGIVLQMVERSIYNAIKSGTSGIKKNKELEITVFLSNIWY